MYKDILFAVDLDDESSWRKALPTVVEYCRAFGSTLHVVTVVPYVKKGIAGQFFPTDYQQQVSDAAMAALHAFTAERVPKDVAVQHVVAAGRAYEEILRASRDIQSDLIVMASHRPELSDYLLGPNAARVVRHAGCSVLVVRE